MARPSMAGLIARLRALVDDAANTFTDDVIQATLDQYRVRLNRIALTPTSPNRFTWSCVYSNLEAIELYDGTTQVTPATSNLDGGDFTFSTAPSSIVAYGYAYDINRAAAELWLLKAGRTDRWKGNYQQYAQMQAEFFLGRSWPSSVEVARV